jgi:hypothetical protein
MASPIQGSQVLRLHSGEKAWQQPVQRSLLFVILLFNCEILD